MNDIEVVLTPTALEIRGEGQTKSIPYTQLDTVLSKVFPLSGILMPAVRWMSQGGHAVVMERPPFIARASYRPAAAGQLAEDSAQHYNIPVPWQVYGIAFSEDFREIKRLFVFARNAPILDLDATLHMFPYPNVFNTSEACMGDNFKKEFAKHPASTLSEAIAKVLNTFWSADFNEDAGPNTWYAAWRAPMDSMPAEWQQTLTAEQVVPWKLLRYYSEIGLENFVRFRFPISNNLVHTGDNMGELINKLQDDEPTSLASSEALLASLRKLYAMGLRASKPQKDTVGVKPMTPILDTAGVANTLNATITYTADEF